MGLLLILLAWPAFAQEPQPVFRAGTALVRVDVQAVEGGKTVEGLAAGDFMVLDEGVEQPVEYFGRETEALSLVLLLDVSGSMRRHLNDMAATARAALRALRDQDRVAIMIFAREAAVREDFSGDHERTARLLADMVRDERVGSATELNRAVVAAAAHVREKAVGAGRRGILIVTDNRGLNFQAPDEEAVGALWGADAVLNAIVAGGGSRPKPDPPGAQLNPDFTPFNVFRLTEETGGETLRAERAGAAFREILERMRTRYSLHYRLPEQARAGETRSIRVELRKHPKAQVRARGGYRVP
jgi:VWFA-related protein